MVLTGPAGDCSCEAERSAHGTIDLLVDQCPANGTRGFSVSGAFGLHNPGCGRWPAWAIARIGQTTARVATISISRGRPRKAPPKGGAFFCLRASDGSAEIAADATGPLPLIFVPLPWRNCACRAASVHTHESRRRVQSGFYLNFGQQLREMRAPHPPHPAKILPKGSPFRPDETHEDLSCD